MSSKEIIGVEDLLRKVTTRADLASSLIEQLPELTEQAIQQVNLRAQVVELNLIEETRRPYQLGVSIAEYGKECEDPEIFALGFAMVKHIQEDKPISEFLETNPQFSSVDLSQFFEARSDWQQVAIGDIPAINLKDSLTNGFPVGNVYISREIDIPEETRVLVVKPKKDKNKKDEKNTNKTVEIIGQSETKIEDVKDVYPAVKQLLEGEQSEWWEDVDGEDCISQSNFVRMFEQKEIVGKDPDQSKYQAVLGLVKKYCKQKLEIDEDSFYKTKKEGRKKYISKNELPGLFVFAADNLSGERPNLKITEADSIPLNSKKKVN